jgi:hypothetical protein
MHLGFFRFEPPIPVAPASLLTTMGASQSQFADCLLNDVQERNDHNDSPWLSVRISLLLVLRGDVLEREVNRGQRAIDLGG